MQTEHNIVYGAIGERELRLDIYRPDSALTARTAIILIHGGAFRMGDRSSMDIFAVAAVKQGYVALAAEYRLLGEAPWPAALEDIKLAIGWARRNADRLGVDPGRIVLQGFSAGGILTLLAAAEANIAEAGSVAAAIPFFAAVEFIVGEATATAADLRGMLGEAATAEAALRASAIHRISPSFPPTFLLHGTADWLVPHGHSQRMFDALVAGGIDADLHLYAGHSHEFARLPGMIDGVQAEIDLFLRRMVVDRQAHEAENREKNIFAAGPEAFAAMMANPPHA